MVTPAGPLLHHLPLLAPASKAHQRHQHDMPLSPLGSQNHGSLPVPSKFRNLAKAVYRTKSCLGALFAAVNLRTSWLPLQRRCG